jgi:hypothetical protein
MRSVGTFTQFTWLSISGADPATQMETPEFVTSNVPWPPLEAGTVAWGWSEAPKVGEGTAGWAQPDKNVSTSTAKDHRIEGERRRRGHNL